MSKGKILFQLSGSISCFKACHVISRLVQNGYEVECVATEAALKFIGPATLEGLTGRTVHFDNFAPGQNMQHIHLMRWADLAILCPATASTINKMASGIADDLLSSLFLAHDFKKPYLIAPAMNTQMLHHPATRNSLSRLNDWGIRVLSSSDGALACGETGEGRLLEPEEIFRQIEKTLQRTPIGLRILVTSGGTREPIDSVRSVTNTSTGRTGAAIADYLSSRGHQVTFLSAENSAQPQTSKPFAGASFCTYSDLQKELKRELGSHHFDALIHAAAVGDYSLDTSQAFGRKPFDSTKKIESDEDLVLHFKRNPKIIDEVRSYSRNPEIKVVGFKLTSSATSKERTEAVRRLVEHAKPDFVIQNDISEISGEHHLARLFATSNPLDLQVVSESTNKDELARAIEEAIEQSLVGSQLNKGKLV